MVEVIDAFTNAGASIATVIILAFLLFQQSKNNAKNNEVIMKLGEIVQKNTEAIHQLKEVIGKSNDS